MIFDKGIRKISNMASEQNIITFDNPAGWITGNRFIGSKQSNAMKLSAVNACVEIISNSISKLPMYVIDTKTKDRPSHPLLTLLQTRPNEAMTPSVYKKLCEIYRLMWGNSYSVIIRDINTSKPIELLPLAPDYTIPFIDDNGVLWYVFTNPKTGERRKLPSCDVVHLKAYSEDGITGISVLQRASEVIATAQSAQRYEQKLYTQNARPSGILKVDSLLEKPAKDKIREEWASIHSGADNAFKIAILDLGLEYQQISISNKDAQFVESKAVSVEDISRFFNVPIYKLNAGKQSYSSNEQNAIEYVVNTLHPIACQYEEEYTYKGLFNSEILKGFEVKVNLMAELKGDFATRGKWYTSMRLNGSFSVDDILSLEDMKKVPGGDVRLASVNYVPLELFRDISIKRNGGDSK